MTAFTSGLLMMPGGALEWSTCTNKTVDYLINSTESIVTPGLIFVSIAMYFFSQLQLDATKLK